MLELCTGGELFDRIIEYGHLTEKQAASVNIGQRAFVTHLDAAVVECRQCRLDTENHLEILHEDFHRISVLVEPLKLAC